MQNELAGFPQKSERVDTRPPSRRMLLIAACLYGLLCLYFASVEVTGCRHCTLNQVDNYLFPPIYFTGAVLVARKLRQSRAGAAPAAMRRLQWVLMLALCASFLGSLGWIYYALRGIDLPYPSYNDAAYVAATVFWLIGLGMLFWILDTNIRDEMGPFIDLLAVTWSLTVLLIGYMDGISNTSGNLLKLSFDILYPLTSALSCALSGCIFLGPQFRRLHVRWRWFVVLVYVGFLIDFFANLGFSLTTSISPQSPSYQFFYFSGNPLDFLFVTADFLLSAAVALMPLDQPPIEHSDIPSSDFIGGLTIPR